MLGDLRRAGDAVHRRYLALAVADSDRRLAEVRADGKCRIAETEAKLLEATCHGSEAARRAQCCEVTAEQQRSAQAGERAEPAAGTDDGQQKLPTPDPDRLTDATVPHQ